MDNHPIPQDVTGFQFKLIGNMTIKQFAYLISGFIFAWILLQLPVNIFIKFPFCAFSAAFGAGLAFFPISGRPMDSMIGNYIKALIRPTQFVYEKTGGQIYFSNSAPLIPMRSMRQYNNDLNIFPKDKLKAYLESLDTKPKNKADEKENNFLMSVSNLAAASSHYLPNASYPNISETSPQPSLITHADSQKPLDQTMPLAKPQIKTAQTPRNLNKSIGMLNIPDSPNLITGITKDPRGNALSNILIEVKDKDSNPIRAFKTNESGKFASATPLMNGRYTIEFEDPKAQNKFEQITIDVTGQIIAPIEVVSIDTREELRRSLFNVN